MAVEGEHRRDLTGLTDCPLNAVDDDLMKARHNIMWSSCGRYQHAVRQAVAIIASLGYLFNRLSLQLERRRQINDRQRRGLGLVGDICRDFFFLCSNHTLVEKMIDVKLLFPAIKNNFCDFIRHGRNLLETVSGFIAGDQSRNRDVWALGLRGICLRWSSLQSTHYLGESADRDQRDDLAGD